MGGISLAIGLTCVGMGLPMIAAESGAWDLLGLILLAGGATLSLAGAFILWTRGDPGASAAEAGGTAISNPQVGGNIYVGDGYQLAKTPAAGSPLNRAIANALTELDAIRRRLVEAEHTGRLIALPANCHQPVADLMADRGWVDSRRILDEAYNSCDGLQHRLKVPERRWDGGPIPQMIEPRIEESDNLPEVLGQVDAAIKELHRLQGQPPN